MAIDNDHYGPLDDHKNCQSPHSNVPLGHKQHHLDNNDPNSLSSLNGQKLLTNVFILMVIYDWLWQAFNMKFLLTLNLTAGLELKRIKDAYQHLEKLNDTYCSLLKMAGISPAAVPTNIDVNWSKPTKYSNKASTDQLPQLISAQDSVKSSKSTDGKAKGSKKDNNLNGPSAKKKAKTSPTLIAPKDSQASSAPNVSVAPTHHIINSSQTQPSIIILPSGQTSDSNLLVLNQSLLNSSQSGLVLSSGQILPIVTQNTAPVLYLTSPSTTNGPSTTTTQTLVSEDTMNGSEELPDERKKGKKTSKKKSFKKTSPLEKLTSTVAKVALDTPVIRQKKKLEGLKAKRQSKSASGTDILAAAMTETIFETSSDKTDKEKKRSVSKSKQVESKKVEKSKTESKSSKKSKSKKTNSKIETLDGRGGNVEAIPTEPEKGNETPEKNPPVNENTVRSDTTAASKITECQDKEPLEPEKATEDQPIVPALSSQSVLPEAERIDIQPPSGSKEPEKAIAMNNEPRGPQQTSSNNSQQQQQSSFNFESIAKNNELSQQTNEMLTNICENLMSEEGELSPFTGQVSGSSTLPNLPDLMSLQFTHSPQFNYSNYSNIISGPTGNVNSSESNNVQLNPPTSVPSSALSTQVSTTASEKSSWMFSNTFVPSFNIPSSDANVVVSGAPPTNFQTAVSSSANVTSGYNLFNPNTVNANASTTTNPPFPHFFGPTPPPPFPPIPTSRHAPSSQSGYDSFAPFPPFVPPEVFPPLNTAGSSRNTKKTSQSKRQTKTDDREKVPNDNRTDQRKRQSENSPRRTVENENSRNAQTTNRSSSQSRRDNNYGHSYSRTFNFESIGQNNELMPNNQSSNYMISNICESFPEDNEMYPPNNGGSTSRSSGQSMQPRNERPSDPPLFRPHQSWTGSSYPNASQGSSSRSVSSGQSSNSHVKTFNLNDILNEYPNENGINNQGAQNSDQMVHHRPQVGSSSGSGAPAIISHSSSGSDFVNYSHLGDAPSSSGSNIQQHHSNSSYYRQPIGGSSSSLNSSLNRVPPATPSSHPTYRPHQDISSSSAVNPFLSQTPASSASSNSAPSSHPSSGHRSSSSSNRSSSNSVSSSCPIPGISSNALSSSHAHQSALYGPGPPPFPPPVTQSSRTSSSSNRSSSNSVSSSCPIPGISSNGLSSSHAHQSALYGPGPPPFPPPVTQSSRTSSSSSNNYLQSHHHPHPPAPFPPVLPSFNFMSTDHQHHQHPFPPPVTQSSRTSSSSSNNYLQSHHHPHPPAPFHPVLPSFNFMSTDHQHPQHWCYHELEAWLCQ